MNKIELDIRDEVVKLVREELEYVEGSHKEGTYYSQWVMAVAIKEISKDSYIARVVIKTNQSPYGDGTDIRVNVIDKKVSSIASNLARVPGTFAD